MDEKEVGPETLVRERPPLGLMPRYIWEERRMYEVVGAIHRYMEARYEIPLEWLEELSYLNKRLLERK